MESKNKRNQILAARWGLYFLVLLTAAALQSTPGFLRIGSWKPFLIPGVCIAVSVQEDEFSGALFSVVGGMLWDLTAGRTIGSFSIVMMFIGFFSSIMVQLYLKRAYANIYLLNAGGGLIAISMDFLFGYLMTGYPRPLYHYFYVLLPEVLLSAGLALLSMRVVHAIAKRLSLP